MKAGMSLLDLKLGVRMLVKYPGLTLVGGLGMAVAIAIGAGAYAYFNSYLHPTLPLDEGDRVVGIENWDAAASRQEPRSLHDFAAWRDELESVRDVGAFRTIRRNLIAPGGPAEPVAVAEMTASGFRVARVAPLLGRLLDDEDEREGAPPVVVVGHEAWRTRFSSDPALVGKSVRLGNAVHAVVGVMPEGFAFPVSHQTGRPCGRTRPTTRGGAGRRSPCSGGSRRVRPWKRPGPRWRPSGGGRRPPSRRPTRGSGPAWCPYTALFADDWGAWEMRMVQLLVTLLLVVVCANVASLVYARTATRQGEVAVRSALGASRRRIVAQLFVEALVLAAAAAAAGLLLAGAALARVDVYLERQPGGGDPFWIDYGLSPATVLYTLGLAVLAALIVGVVPALGATGRRLRSGLGQLGGATGMRLGRTWTVLIVAQVAVAVAVLPTAVHMGWEWIRFGLAEPGFAADEFLTARLAMDREAPPGADAAAYAREFPARFGKLQAELARRLEAEPGVAGVTFSGSVPGAEPAVRVEVEGVAAGAASSPGHEVRADRVAPGFFDVYGVPVLTGRRLGPGDLGPGAAAVVVNRGFVRQFLGGGGALGRRVRYVAGDDDGDSPAELGRWYEIVGVVDDFPARELEPGLAPGKLYHAAAPGEATPVLLSLRTRGSPRPRPPAGSARPPRRWTRPSSCATSSRSPTSTAASRGGCAWGRWRSPC